MVKGILEEGKYLDPRYAYLEPFAQKIFKGFWTPAKYERGVREDVRYVKTEMSEVDRSFISKSALCVAMIEDKVKMGWGGIGRRVPQTIVSDITQLISMQEVTHRRSYFSLNEEMGISPEDALKYEVLRDRLKYLNKHLEKDPRINGNKELLKDIILFSAMVEKCGLMNYFYFIMSYANANKGLKTMFDLQRTTAVEEEMHYEFGLALVKQIKEDYPDLWDEYIKEYVVKQVKVAHETELRIVDWLLEEGTPDHISKEEMVNFINYNFNQVCTDFELDLDIKFDEEKFQEKSSWMKVSMYSSEPDFFSNKAGSYSFEEEFIDMDSFEF